MIKLINKNTQLGKHRKMYLCLHSFLIYPVHTCCSKELYLPWNTFYELLFLREVSQGQKWGFLNVLNVLI